MKDFFAEAREMSASELDERLKKMEQEINELWKGMTSIREKLGVIQGPTARMGDSGVYLGKSDIEGIGLNIDKLQEIFDDWCKYLRIEIEDVTLSSLILCNEAFKSTKIGLHLEGEGEIRLEALPRLSCSAIMMSLSTDQDKLAFFMDLIKLQEAFKHSRVVLNSNQCLSLETRLNLRELTMESFARSFFDLVHGNEKVLELVKKHCKSLDGLLA